MKCSTCGRLAFWVSDGGYGEEGHSIYSKVFGLQDQARSSHHPLM